MKEYDEYIVVMPAKDALKVANLLASLGIALEGTVLEIEEGEDDPLFRITPRDIRAAWKAMDTALHENWLGYGQREIPDPPVTLDEYRELFELGRLISRRKQQELNEKPFLEELRDDES